MSGTQPTDASLAELLCALSYATGLGLGDRIDHGLKSAYVGLRIADALGLAAEDREAVYYGALLKDVGCTACAAGFSAFFPDDELVPRLDFMLVDPASIGSMVGWLSRNVALDRRLPERVGKLLSFVARCGAVIKESMTGHCEVAETFARRLGFPEGVQRAVRFQLERWDGKGMAYGLTGDESPIAARILHAAQTLELTQSIGGRSAATALARERRGTRFDPLVVDAFLALSERADFWSPLEQEDAGESILSMRPPTIAERSTEEQVDEVCEALAAFTDIKARETWHHSRAVAELAVDIGRQMGLNSGELTRLRRAALVHDLGNVAVPFAIVAEAEGESLSERHFEQARLHPYYTQRILERVAPLSELAEAAAAHHEWMNGRGYHRQLAGDQIPLNGRVLAVADAYENLTRQPGAPQDPRERAARLRPLVGDRFDAQCYEALAAAVTGSRAAPASPGRARHPGGLSEREVEVLRLLAQGLSNPQIAQALVVSKKTVEHHLEHIYNKLGISSRTAAVVFAVQYGLV